MGNFGLPNFDEGGDYDAMAHVRFLRDAGGASSGYTADMIELLYESLPAIGAYNAMYEALDQCERILRGLVPIQHDKDIQAEIIEHRDEARRALAKARGDA